MNQNQKPLFGRSYFCVLLCLFAAIASSASAAPPNLTYLFPAGAKRGTTVEVTAAGSFDSWPAKVWASGTGVKVEAGKAKGKFAVTVAADAVPGVYWLRAHDEGGASSVRPFVVGTLPEVVEKEPNDEFRSPQKIELSGVVVNGQLGKSGDVDGFAVPLKKGQTVVASLLADRVLKSPMDSVLQVVSADGFVLEQNHDHIGLDPQLAFTAPADGTYVVRAFAFPSQPDSSVRLSGADTYVYRLTLTTGGFADFPLPLAVARDKPGKVEVVGWNVPDAAKTLAVKPTDGEEFATVFHPALANPLRVRVEPHAALDLTRTPPKEPLPPPFSATARVEKPGAASTVSVAGKKGQALTIQVQSRALGQPVNPVVRVLDAAGKVLSRTEPAQPNADVSVNFTPTADGPFAVEVRDLYGDGGPRFAYLLRVLTAVPDYDLTVVTDRFTVIPGKPLDIPVKVNRRGGFAKEVTLAAEGLADGIKAEVLPPEGKKADPATVMLRVTAEKPGVGSAVRVVGSVKGEPALTRTATAPLAGFDDTTHDLWVSAATSAPPAVVPKKKR